jgi:hypothetical protein
MDVQKERVKRTNEMCFFKDPGSRNAIGLSSRMGKERPSFLFLYRTGGKERSVKKEKGSILVSLYLVAIQMDQI